MKNRFFVTCVASLALLAGCTSADDPVVSNSERAVSIKAGVTSRELINAGRYEMLDYTVDAFNLEEVKADYVANLVLVSFDRDISSEDALKELQALGLEPANTVECLAYGAATAEEFAGEYVPHWLVCLNSKATVENAYGIGVPRVMGIFQDDTSHVLSSDPSSTVWDQKNLFLAVET